MSSSKMSRYVKDFEENPFWQKVMRPAMEASILVAKDQLVYSDDIREIRRIQAGIKMTQEWLGFPKRKHSEAELEAEFEKSRRDAEGGEEGAVEKK